MTVIQNISRKLGSDNVAELNNKAVFRPINKAIILKVNTLLLNTIEDIRQVNNC
jgi:capsid portal protein